MYLDEDEGIHLCHQCLTESFPSPKWDYKKATGDHLQTPTDTDVNLVLRRFADIDEDIQSTRKQVDWLSRHLEDAESDLRSMISAKESYTVLLKSASNALGQRTAKVAPRSARGHTSTSRGDSVEVTRSFVLPDELWLEVFTLALEDTGFFSTPTKDLQKVCSVCRLWRRIILNAPTLWRRLVIRDELDFPFFVSNDLTPRLAQTLLERSKSLPLSLELLPIQEHVYRDYAAIIDTAYRRIQHFSFRVEQASSLEFAELLLSGLPALRDLKISAGGSWRTLPKSLFTQMAISSGLTSLHLESVTFLTELPVFAYLQNLSVCGYSGYQIHSILKQCPNIVSLHVSDSSSASGHSHPTTIPNTRNPVLASTLESLTFENIKGDQDKDPGNPLKVLSLLIPPNLKSLSIQFSCRQVWYDDEDENATSSKTKFSDHFPLILQFLQQGKINLNHLSLVDLYSISKGLTTMPGLQMEGVIQLHGLQENLETLHLNALSEDPIKCLFIERMHYGTHMLLPHLREVKLAIFDKQLRSTLEMLHSRRSSLRVVELMVFEYRRPLWQYAEEEDEYDMKEAWLDRYAMNDPEVIAGLAELRGEGMTVSCFMYPRLDVDDVSLDDSESV